MIVVFSHAHPSISKGGAEVSAYTLYLGLRQLGRAATFVAMCPQSQLAQVRLDTEDEIAVPYRPEHYDHLFHMGPPALGHELIGALAPLRPTALVFHHFLFLGVNTIRTLVGHFDVPSAIVLHEFLAICHHHGQMVTRPRKTLCEKATPTRCAACFPELAPEELHARRHNFHDLLTAVTALVSPSEFLARRFAHWGIPAARIRVIENGLAGFERPGEPRAARRRPAASRFPFGRDAEGRAVVFGYFGQINPFKGVDLILDALRKLEKRPGQPAITVRVHGNLVGVTDTFREAFDAAVRDGSLQYHGPYVNTDVHALMQRCDYVLMASRWWENSPVVIQEAFAAGRPVIVPALGGMAEKVEPGKGGRHFEPDNPDSLAAVLQACLTDDTAYCLPVPSTAREMATRYLDLLAQPHEPHATRPH